MPSRWPPRGNLTARRQVPAERRGSSCDRYPSPAQSGAGSCPRPAESRRSFFDVASRRSIQFPLVFEGLKVTSCLAPTEAVKRGCLAHRHTTLRVEEFGVATSGGVWVAIGELQSFTDVQTHKFARHTGSSHPCVLRRQAAVAFTSAPIRARYLPLQRICFASKTGQLTQGGLPPPKIGSLDGCSASPVA